MALPELSPEQRQAALKKAAEARTARKELREQVKSGKLTFAQVLAKAGDPVVDNIKVITLIESLPGYGKAKATKLLDELGISDSRRVRGLGDKQKVKLLERLG
ncbi:MAG: integration host factor [Coriobacteriales bacterium]|jgi:hypothetical protein|nr:integration host factor [Coriobacteriales bacterium]